MKKLYDSSKNRMLKNDSSATNYGGTITNVIKQDKTGIEKNYISEGYDYKKEVIEKTPENIDREKDIEERYKRNENYNKDIYKRNKEYHNLNTYKEQERRASFYDGEIDLDRVKSYRDPKYKVPSYKTYEENKQATPENIDNMEGNIGFKKHDTEFVSRGMASSFIIKKLKPKDMIYYRNRHEDNNISKLINRDSSNILNSENKGSRRRGKNEGRNEEKTIRPDGIIEKNLTTRTLENKYIRSRFAENMGDTDESFSVNISKTGIISGEKALRLGANLGRYTSVNAINLFKKEKLNNSSLKSTLTRSTKDAIINFKGGTSDDLGVETVVNIKDKAISTRRLITDRKGFIKTSITNFQLEGNQDLGIKTVIQTKDATILGGRVVKGIYGTTKTTAKTAKRSYQIGRKITHKVAYGINKIGKVISNPVVLKGIITIAIPLILILLMVSAIIAIFPASTAIASYPIAEVEFIQELQDNINIWNEEINNTIQSYYNDFDDVVIVNDDMVLVQLQDVLAILAVETEQNMGFEDMDKAREIYELFFTLETEIETYEEIETTIDSETGEEIEITIEKIRIIVDLKNLSIEEVIQILNYDDTDREWTITLAMADLTEMYPDLVVSNEIYYPSLPSLTPDEIEKYGGMFIHPTNNVGYISSSFGYRIDPITKIRTFHNGLDIAGNDRTPIYAAQDGVIIFSGVNGGYGNCVIIDHGEGMITLYAHCSSLSVTKGESVSRGDNIARVGNTGRSTGPHLHFEVRINGKLINPINFLD